MARTIFAVLPAFVTLAACGGRARLPETAVVGSQPTIAEPRPSLFPVFKVARAVRWRDAETPTPAPGLAINAFVTGLEHPRWLYVLPNGDVLVAESNAPPNRKA
jgi:glucose/arabinose dehydrogenase